MKRIVVVAMFVWLWSCAAEETVAPQDGTEIFFDAAGGIAGSVFHRMQVEPDGSVTLSRHVPLLHARLDSEVHRRMLRMMTGIWEMPERLGSHFCADDIRFLIKLTASGRTRQVISYGCTLSEMADSDPMVGYFRSVVEFLAEVEDRLYRENAPWIGLETRFLLDDSVYRRREPITIRAVLRNPTQKIRKVYFHTDQRITFCIASLDLGRYVQCSDPLPPPRPEDSLQVVEISPGGEQVFETTWGAPVDENAAGLPPGRYRVSAGLAATVALGSGLLDFTVIDEN